MTPPPPTAAAAPTPPKEATGPSSPLKESARAEEPGPTFVRDLCKSLDLRNITTCTALIYFHKYFTRFSYKQQDKFVVSVACVFLACKVEEQVESLENVLLVALKLRNSVLDEEQRWKKRESVLRCERNLLQALDFQICVDHAHSHASAFLKGQANSREIQQVAWNFLNDALTTDMCLTVEPKLLAAAAVSLAVRFKKEQMLDLGYSPSEITPIEVELLKIYDDSEKEDAGEKKRVRL